jgi:hypothetical protein
MDPMRTAAALLPLLLASCSLQVSSYMRDATPAAPAAAPKDARVVVFRPSTFGGNTQFPIYEYLQDDGKLMGFAESGCYFEYRCPPGKHLFLTWGEGEAFIDADLAPGKTYYVRCFARFGVLAPRPQFKPVVPGTEEWSKLDEELKDLKPRELDAAKAEAFEEAKEERARKAKQSHDDGRKAPSYLRIGDGR